MTLKLASLAASDTATLELRFGDDSPMLKADGKPVTVTVYGPGSKPYAAAKAAQQNRLVARLQRGKGMAETPEEKAKHEADFLALVTASDDGLDIEGLTDGLSGAEKYRAIYSHTPIAFIGEQVAKFAGDWANFSTGSAKS